MFDHAEDQLLASKTSPISSGYGTPEQSEIETAGRYTVENKSLQPGTMKIDYQHRMEERLQRVIENKLTQSLPES
jgi:hypothetical protein